MKTVKSTLVCLGLYVLFVEMFSSSMADVDLWGYLAFGRAFWETGEFPYRDIFAYTPTKELWVYHEWLTGIVYYFIFKHAGGAGLQLLRYGLVLVTLYVIYLTALKRGSTALAACIALAPAMLLISFGYVPVRAQMFSYLFFAVTLYVLESARVGRRWWILAWLPPVQVLWCNFHGGFVAGIGLIFLYAAGEALSGRRSLPILAAGLSAAAATLVNPYGIHYWVYIFQAVVMSRPEIDEWLSVIGAIRKNIYLLPAYLFAVMAFLALVCSLPRRRRDYADLLVVAAMIFIGMSHVRHTVFLGLVFGATVPSLVSGYWDVLKEKRAAFRPTPWIPGCVFVCVILLIQLLINPFRIPPLAPDFNITASPSRYPVGAVSFIMQQGLKGNILPLFEWGEFIIWHLNPGCRVAMDGRYETVFEPQVCREYFDFLLARPAWRLFLQKYPHEMILIPPGIAVAGLLKQEKGWRIAYEDQRTLLLVRGDNPAAVRNPLN